jgi:hypothetical protein
MPSPPLVIPKMQTTGKDVTDAELVRVGRVSE